MSWWGQRRWQDKWWKVIAAWLGKVSWRQFIIIVRPFSPLTGGPPRSPQWMCGLTGVRAGHSWYRLKHGHHKYPPGLPWQPLPATGLLSARACLPQVSMMSVFFLSLFFSLLLSFVQAQLNVYIYMSVRTCLCLSTPLCIHTKVVTWPSCHRKLRSHKPR